MSLVKGVFRAGKVACIHKEVHVWDCDGVCDVKMVMMRGPRCKSEESKYRWDPHGSSSQVWALIPCENRKKQIK